METRDIKIRSVDVETIKRIDRMAKQKTYQGTNFYWT